MDFYYYAGSAPCRSILMTAKALGIEMNLKDIDLFKGEQMTPEFLKINPQHTIPTLNDNGFCLWESRAIMVYLVDKYGKDSTLYPKDPKTRAIVNQRLYFDMGTLYRCSGEYFYPQFFAKAPADPEKFKKMEEAFGFLNTFLKGQKYAAGEDITVADLALVATVSTVVLVKDFDMDKFLTEFPNVARWYKLVKKTAPGYSLNEDGIAQFRELLKNL